MTKRDNLKDLRRYGFTDYPKEGTKSQIRNEQNGKEKRRLDLGRGQA